jgi:hypothetical protein
MDELRNQIPKDLYKEVVSYLSKDEIIYYHSESHNFLIDSDIICDKAAINGWLDLLKWLRLNGFAAEWNHITCALAARYGHLELLKWIRENGFASCVE